MGHFCGPRVGILTKNSSEKSNAQSIPGIPTPSGLTLIDAIGLGSGPQESRNKDDCISFSTLKSTCENILLSSIRVRPG